MNAEKVNHYTVLMADKIPEAEWFYFQKLLKEREVEEQQLLLVNMQFKEPTTALILSILVGYLGVDRFYLGDFGLGIGKLLTCGGLYIWWIVDIFLIMKATKNRNWTLLYNYLSTCPKASEGQY